MESIVLTIFAVLFLQLMQGKHSRNVSTSAEIWTSLLVFVFVHLLILNSCRRMSYVFLRVLYCLPYWNLLKFPIWCHVYFSSLQLLAISLTVLKILDVLVFVFFLSLIDFHALSTLQLDMHVYFFFSSNSWSKQRLKEA